MLNNWVISVVMDIAGGSSGVPRPVIMRFAEKRDRLYRGPEETHKRRHDKPCRVTQAYFGGSRVLPFQFSSELQDTTNLGIDMEMVV
jgi:hypothetical protein